MSEQIINQLKNNMRKDLLMITLVEQRVGKVLPEGILLRKYAQILLKKEQ